MGLLEQQQQQQQLMLLLFLLLPSLAMLKCRANVHRINTASDLVRFSQSVNTGTNYLGTTVFLDSDIDFVGGLSEQFDPIGKISRNYFFGSFDGQGHIISNLVINTSSSQYGGLFGYSEGLTIKNVVIDSSCFIVNYCQNIDNIKIGGIIGQCESENKHCIIENNVNMATVAFGGDAGVFDIYLGGISGYVCPTEYESFVKNCANYGLVTHYGKGNDLYIGGIAGYFESLTSFLVYIQNNFNYGNISHSGESNYPYIGGISGFSSSVNIENCVSAGMISYNSTKQYIFIGSICGYVLSCPSISRCYWSESIGYDAFGGILDSDVSETTSFNKDFVLDETISAGSYMGNSLIEALNAYSSYYGPLEYSHWAINKNESEKSVSFTINNRGSPFTLNSQILLLPSLASDGRLLFDGWYTDKDCKTFLTGFVIGTATELYGRWEENNNYYTVTFNTRGGTPVEPVTEEYLSVVALPDDLVKSGCTIAFWEDEDGNKMEWNFTVPAHNITLYAVWKCAHIATAEDLIDFSKCINTGITYEGTTVFLVSDIDFGGGLSQKFESIGVNSFFLGAFDGQGHAISNLEVKSSLQLVGLFGFYRGPAIKNVVIDASCSFVSLCSYGMHVFVGSLVGYYYADAEPSCIENNVNMANVTFDGDISGFGLYLGGIIGYLKPYSIRMTVRNCANYGSLANSGREDYLYIGGIVGYSEYPSSHVVYIQNALNYGAIAHDGTVSTTVCIGGIMGYSGEYSNIENCVNAGDIASSEPSSYIGSIVGYAESSATSISHCFWTDNVGFNASGSGEPTMDSKTSQAVLGTDLVDVLNKYSGPNEWSRWLLNANRAAVTFVINYGNRNYVIKSLIMVLPDLADNGDRAFSGWYNDEGLRTPFTASGVEADTTVYGMFCAPNYTVTLDANGGDELEVKETVVECNGTYVTLPAPTRTGHTFRGWFTEGVCGREVKSGDRVTNLNNHTLYAHWEINEYTLTINYGNGTTVEETLEFDAIITYSEPTRKGYMFAGWSENITHMPARNITIVAMWKKSSSAQTSYILGVSITVGIVIIIVIIAVLCTVLEKRKEEGGYERIKTGYEISKPLTLCSSGDGDFVREYRRVVMALVDVENDVVTGYTSVLTGLYPDEYTRPTMKETLLATDLTEEQVELICESCESVARKAMVANTPPEGFTEEDAAAVAMYTYDFGSEYFESNPYRIINKNLASGEPENLRIASGLLYLVMAAVRKLPRVIGKTLYRGVRSGVSLDEDRYRRGNVITWVALSSASPDMEATKAFLARGTKSGIASGTLFIIEGGWGYDIQPYSMFPTEAEILLEPERHFKVISVIRTEGMTIVNLQMLETPLSLQHVFGYGMN